MKKRSSAKNPFSVVQWVIICLLFIVVLLYGAIQYIPGFSFNSGENIAVLDTRAVTVHGEDELFGNVLVQTTGSLNLQFAKVLINGEIVGDLDTGSLLIRVHEGDKIAIDTTAYSRELIFVIDCVSSNIDGSVLNGQITTCGNVAEVGIVSFK